jgi:hypothetical protein
MIWNDSTWFSPYSYFLSKDIYNGISYNYNAFKIFDITLAVLSGDGNPAKDYMYYLGNEGSSNLKNNNTPVISGNFAFHYGNLISKNLFGKIFVGIEGTRTGSTYNDPINEGKHTKEIMATGGDIGYNFENPYLRSLRFFGQYTKFLGGLREGSSQDTGHPLFKNIEQTGFFAGTEIGFFKTKGYDFTEHKKVDFSRLKIGFTYEIFDRYDFLAHLYSNGYRYPSGLDGGPRDTGSYLCVKENTGTDTSIEDCGYNYQLDKNARQKSLIFQVKYYLLNNLSLEFAYHKIEDPFNWISGIIPGRGDEKSKLSLHLNF